MMCYCLQDPLSYVAIDLKTIQEQMPLSSDGTKFKEIKDARC